jgi:subtilisin family serine protease
VTSFTRRIAIIGLAFTALIACSQQKAENSHQGQAIGIFSNRPINAMEDIYIFTLTRPALLTSATPSDHGLIIRQEDRDGVLAEQKAFEEQLKVIAPAARIVYRYRLAINGLAIYVSGPLADQLRQLPSVRQVTPALQLARPQAVALQTAAPVQKVTSVSSIGADEAHKLGYTGAGLRVGVIDTGIDYTHQMLGGPGRESDYKAIDPSKPSALFPNGKVVGGLDLVGSDFDAASSLNTHHLPQPDPNPLDEGGHGSHVAGTIAGVGDGVNTYSGVAPDAQLYAIKVFGKDGSTMDATVIAGFEFAVDPNGDLDPSDHLDLVNLSLGGNFGQPQILYNEAVRNVSRAGLLVVAAAGNSGPVDYIVGAPSTADDAFSIAASIDPSEINWRFPAVRLSSVSNPELFVRVFEGPISVPVKDAAGIEGELVHVGLVDQELSEDVKAQLRGKVALIQRGGNPFLEKLTRVAAAGAIGAVVYNNDPGDPIAMGGEGHVDIPAVMVSQAVGLSLIQDMAKGPARVQFKTDRVIELPDNIDTITDFSSKGPRSEDNLLKPEIAAPGKNITSAEMGGGVRGAVMDGTSMASPHAAGAMALIKQAHPDLSVAELKSLAMGTARALNKSGQEIPLTLQGAGLIQLLPAIQASVVSENAAISLGRVQLSGKKSETRTITLRNLNAQDLTLSAETHASPGLLLSVPSTITLPAHGEAQVPVKVDYELQALQQFSLELDGRLVFKRGGQQVLQVPVMAIRTEAAHVTALDDGHGGWTYANSSLVPGVAMAFNLIGEDEPKAEPPVGWRWQGRGCDLRSAGYRIVRERTQEGEEDKIQFAFNLHAPVTTWYLCSLSVLFDMDGDAVADQELAGVTGSTLEGIDKNFISLLLDATAARSLRLRYEQQLAAGDKDAKIDYTSSVLAQGAMAVFNQSGVAILEAPLRALKRSADGKLHFRLAAQAEDGETFEADDYLGATNAWTEISPKLEEQAFFGMDEASEVPAGGLPLTLHKGTGQGRAVIYYPYNDFTTSGADGQQQILGTSTPESKAPSTKRQRDSRSSRHP